MDTRTMKTILEIGETIAVEFKRCGNGIESDVYETVCSFLNRLEEIYFWGFWMTEPFLVCRKSRLQIW